MVDSAPDVVFRRLETSDIDAVYWTFRRSLFAYLFRIGQVDAATAANPPIAEAWARQRRWIEHLVDTAAENWVAEIPGVGIIGWAMSTERDNLLELTHFFVDPSNQARGVGRGLLERAFPRGGSRGRVIIATLDPAALSLYFRFDVSFSGFVGEFFASPRPSHVESDLEISRADANESSVIAMGSVERLLIGHEREVDLRFLLQTRPAWIARRRGQVVGFAFGVEGLASGPLAALDASDLPALLATVESDAAQRGEERISLMIPLTNQVSVDHVLSRGFQIDPFYVLVLSDRPVPGLNRWVHTGPGFIF